MRGILLELAWLLLGIAALSSCVGSEVREGAGAEALQDARVTLVNVWGSRGAGEGRFIIPCGIAFLGGGDVVVTDVQNSRVQRFSASGAFKGVLKPEIPYTGDKPDAFKNGLHKAEGLAVDPEDNIWVADTIRNHRLVRMDLEGRVNQVIGGDGNSTHGSGTDLGSFLWPHGVAVSPGGDLLVATDTGNHRLQIFRTGTRPTQGFSPGKQGRFYLAHVVEDLGGEAGRLSSPAGVKVDGEDRIWVADHGNNRVVVLDEDGAYLREFGGPGRLYHPYGLALGPGGRIAVSDYGNNRIRIHDREGRALFHFGREGTEPGRFRGPTGLAFDERGRLHVADAFNHRIQVFSFDAGAPGRSIPVNAGGPWVRRPDLAGPALGPDPAPRDLARWAAVAVHNDSNIHRVARDGKSGYWGRGYYDWPPPFCTMSMHPLYRQSVWRIRFYLTLHDLTGKADFLDLARGALDYLAGEQPKDGAYRWWVTEAPSAEGSLYVSGLVGEAMAAGYGKFGDRRYLEVLRRICDWALTRETHVNTNYNAFITHPLAMYYRLTKEDRYLRKALCLNLESIPGNLDPDGAMKDGHNRKTVYHYLVLRGLLRLLEVLPESHRDRPRIEEIARKMMDNLLARQHSSGAFVASPRGAEPSERPYIAVPVLALCFADSVLGWRMDRRRISAAVNFLSGEAAEGDDRAVVAEYLRYRYDTTGDREAFAREFARYLDEDPVVASRK